MVRILCTRTVNLWIFPLPTFLARASTNTTTEPGHASIQENHIVEGQVSLHQVDLEVQIGSERTSGRRLRANNPTLKKPPESNPRLLLNLLKN